MTIKTNKKLEHLLSIGKLIMVGSIKTKAKPRDIDIVLVIPNSVFEKEYMPVSLFIEEGETGEWSLERFKWGEDSIELGDIISDRIYGEFSLGWVRGFIDLKIIPGSVYYEN